MGLGKIEIALLIVLVIILLFVGAKKLPELARGIGQSAKELKKGFKDDADDEPAKKTAKKPTKKS
jgi:sec-independent protein translocase protein TatA